jgi:hypothetical protein
VTAEEKAIINRFLNEPGAPGISAGRASALARAALKFAGVLLLAAGVVAGYADGDEFDEVGCSVAMQPGGTSHGAHSGRPREREGGKPAGPDAGSAGGCSAGGGADPPSALNAAIEGDPASGSFCIRFFRPNEGPQAPPAESTGPGPETLGIAAKVFQLLSALNPDKRLRKAPPVKVFLLRFRKNLSRSEIARACDCGTALVSLRLRAIQEKLPWRPQQLRELSAQVEAMQDALQDSRARRIYRKAAVYGDEEEEQGLD